MSDDYPENERGQASQAISFCGFQETIDFATSATEFSLKCDAAGAKTTRAR
jgi:hypothetical protein